MIRKGKSVNVCTLGKHFSNNGARVEIQGWMELLRAHRTTDPIILRKWI